MSNVGNLPKPVDSFEAQKEALGIAYIEMTPIEEIRALEFASVETIPDEMRLYPRFLTDFTPSRELEEGHYAAYGIARFTTKEPSIKDRENHVVPHVPGPDTEHVCLNLLRVVREDVGVIAPIVKLSMRHHITVVPIDEAVLVELHNIKQGELKGASRFKGIGSMLFFLRDNNTGESLAEVLLQYRDLTPSETA